MPAPFHCRPLEAAFTSAFTVARLAAFCELPDARRIIALFQRLRFEVEPESVNEEVSSTL